MLAQCACFESDSTEFAEAGTKRHKHLAARLAVGNAPRGCTCIEDDPAWLCPTCKLEDVEKNQSDEDTEGVEWAAEYITMMGSEFDAEHRLTLYDDSWNEVFSGTPDVVCGAEIFDLKWRERNYDAQMAAYALMLMQAKGYDKVIVHVLYAEPQRVQKLIFDEDSARRIVEPILAAAKDPNKQPTPCDYCGWCANRLRCKALLDRVQAVAAGREDWKLEQYHASQIETPEQAFRARKLAKQIIKWAEGVLYHTEKLADKMTPEQLREHGYEWKPKRGRQYCTDIFTAYELLGLDRELFAQACDLRLNTSKKYPDKKGISDIYKEKHELKLAPAKRVVLAKLEPVLKRGEDSRSLVEIGEESTDEN